MKKSNVLLVMIASLILFTTVFTIPMHTYAMSSYSSTDVEVKFKVYPDGVVELAADYFYNYTYSYMYYTGPSSVYSEVEVSKEDGLTTISTHETVRFPEEQASQFPLNSTEISIIEEYSEDILNAEINGSITFPSKWCGYPPYSSSYTYIDFSSFPFNSTDLTISGQYADGEYNGTLVVHFIPSLTLGDVEINFEGNTTHVVISDSVTVFYNYTLPIPDFPPLNRTIIEEISQNKTYIDQMLYQMTGGQITCEVYNITITPIDENSDKLEIEIVLQGDFVDILAKIYENLITQILYSGYYYYYIPSDQIEIISRDLANITIEHAGEGSFELIYTSSARRIDFEADFSANLEEIWDAAAQLIVKDFPPEYQPYIEEFLETKYASAESFTEKLSYQDGTIEHLGSYTFEGDIGEELNLIKDFCIGFMIEISSEPPPWQVNFINETRIVDMSNFKFSFNGTFEGSTQLVSFSFEGIKIAPPIDPINATCFKLTRFFNLTYSYESTRSNERLKITVKGGSNGTHTVIPVVDPEKVPEPDEILSDGAFVWNNQSISGLKELTFKVCSGFAQYIDKEYVSTEEPCRINAVNVANCEVVVNEIEKDSVIIIKNITLPEGVNPPPGTYKVLGTYVQITSETGEEIGGNFTIKMYYNPEELAKLGIDENSLKIYYWDSDKSEWVAVETHLNSEEHYVWAYVDHLSIWAVMGQVAKPIWTETWFLATLACIIIALIVVAVFLARRRKKEGVAET